VKFRFRFAEWLSRLFQARFTDLHVTVAVHHLAVEAAVVVVLQYHPAAEAAAVAAVTK